MVVDIRSQTGGERLEVLKYPHDPSDYLSQTRFRVPHVGKYYPPYRGGMESHLQVLSEDLKRMVDLLDQPDRRSELGFGARQRVAHKFKVAKMIRGIYDLYHDVMSGQWMEKVHS